ncbi:MAG: hypothetical protein CMJ25_13110 [Phycisphaerae bacterium]|nr:hypothetical protein [Phycisphaerae bacterium]
MFNLDLIQSWPSLKPLMVLRFHFGIQLMSLLIVITLVLKLLRQHLIEHRWLMYLMPLLELLLHLKTKLLLQVR